MPDDSRFIAAAQTAIRIAELFGDLPGRRKAETVGLLTFLLLDFLKAELEGVRHVQA